MPTNIVIRADASPLIGAGHVMRCLALAQAWIDIGAKVHWVARQLMADAHRRLVAEGIDVTVNDSPPDDWEDALRTVHCAEHTDAEWVVLDGYTLGPTYQIELKKAGRRVLVIDDYGHAAGHGEDIVLNQNFPANPRLYQGKDIGPVYLIGYHYALLRREFRQALLPAPLTPSKATNLLVTLGGAGEAQLAGNVFDALKSLGSHRDLTVRFIFGASLRIQGFDLKGTEGWLTPLQHVDDMAAEMRWAHIAVSAAGSTVYELMRMGVPSLLATAAANQEPIAQAMHEFGAAVSLGPGKGLTPEAVATAVTKLLDDHTLRASMSAKGRTAVDGEGALRVRRVMEGAMIRLRCARPEDELLVWEWANDPVVRAASFSTEPIPWEDHVRWYRTRLADAQRPMFIAECQNGIPVGTVGFELIEDTAVISVSLDRSRRGAGYGRWLIRLGSLDILRRGDIARILAFIRPENVASIRAFENAGFCCHSRTVVREQPALLFTFPSRYPLARGGEG